MRNANSIYYDKKKLQSMKVARMSEAFPQAVITDNYIFLSGMPGLGSNYWKSSQR